MINPATEDRRQAYIEALYRRSGRTCSTYSGLFQQRQQELMERDIDEVLNDPG